MPCPAEVNASLNEQVFVNTSYARFSLQVTTEPIPSFIHGTVTELTRAS
jgi:hypothetical protein